VSLLLKENAIQEVVEGCTNPLAVFLPNYPINKQQLDVVTSKVCVFLIVSILFRTRHRESTSIHWHFAFGAMLS